MGCSALTAAPADLLCIGHRGAMGHAPENTLASFAKALVLRAPCVELDVHAVEGQLLVFHDKRLERTSNGHGFVQDASLAYVRGLDAGQGERIPTLDEVLALIDRKAGVNIELKGADTALPVAACLTRLRGQGWPEELLLVSSFDRTQLRILRQRDPQLRLGLLCKKWQADSLEVAGELRAYSVHLALAAVNPERVAQARKNGLRTLVYTVNNPPDISRMREFGVDGVFSNYPERVLQGNAKSLAPGWA